MTLQAKNVWRVTIGQSIYAQNYRPKGVCSFKDDLQPILQKAVEADVLVCGSPNYCGYPSAALRAFMERMEFPIDLEKAYELGKRLVAKAKE